MTTGMRVKTLQDESCSFVSTGNGSCGIHPAVGTEHLPSSVSVAQQGTWGRSPRAGGHGGCPPINLLSYLEAEQRESVAQPEAPR